MHTRYCNFVVSPWLYLDLWWRRRIVLCLQPVLRFDTGSTTEQPILFTFNFSIPRSIARLLALISYKQESQNDEVNVNFYFLKRLLIDRRIPFGLEDFPCLVA